MHRWDVIVNGMNHEIVYSGYNLSGQAKISVDGHKHEAVAPIGVRKVGVFYPITVDGSKIILKFNQWNKPLGLIQDGVYQDTGLPLEEEAAAAIRSAAALDLDPTARKDKAGMTSFLTLAVLTYVNIILILIDASISFPFSAFVPQLAAGIGLLWYQETGVLTFVIAGTAAALVLATVYLALYLLARRGRLWPIVTALALIAIDTAILLYFGMEDLASIIIDLLFHAWVLWSLFRLMSARRAKNDGDQPAA